MDSKETEKRQEINRIKAENDCLICEVVVTKEFKEAPVSIVKGLGGPIELAQMINTLIDVSEQLKNNFPETKQIIPMLKEQGGMKTTYRKVEIWE